MAMGLRARAQGPAAPTVTLRDGRLRGKRSKGVSAFLGIRYGESTAGAARFLPPRKAAPWAGVRDAVAFGPKCPQLALPLGPELSKVFLFADVEQSEDCLSLNVWTPAVGKGARPVMVWIHGGGFSTGTAAEPDYEGSNLARENDVVVVSVSHRLNVFGYLDVSAAGPQYAQSGNAGMLDLVLALEWVRENVSALGGDPSNVTIFGQSGGGYKVSILMAMPAAKGLFHKAIVMSGPGLKAGTRATGAQTAAAVTAKLGLTTRDIDKLQTLPTGELLAASAAAPLRPIVDGASLRRDPFDPDAPPQAANIPLLIGATADEATSFLLADPKFATLTEDDLRQRATALTSADRVDQALAIYKQAAPDDPPSYRLVSLMTDQSMVSGSIKLAERKLAQPAPVYMYKVAWRSPGLDGRLRAAHGVDLPLAFDNVGASPGLTGTGPGARAVAKQMSRAFAAFARKGTPATADLPVWPTYTVEQRQTMIFDVPPRVESDPGAPQRRFWNGP